MQDQGTRAAWADAFTRRALAHWTRERTEQLASGKRLLLPPAECAPLLRAIGLLHRDASMPPDCLRKYWQVSHAVRILEPLVRQSARQSATAGGTVRLLDAGCGRSYLSLVLAWCARSWGLPVQVLGVDREEGLVRACQRRASLAGLEGVFQAVEGKLAELDLGAAWRGAFGEPGPVHGVMALHACDTATCDALVLGVSLQADWLAVAPCCQAELARGWSERAKADSALGPVHRSPHLSRQIAAHLTDTLRTLLLRAYGYEVTAMEFVPAEHTPKNTLLRATRTGLPDERALAEHDALVEATGGVELALRARLEALALRSGRAVQ